MTLEELVRMFNEPQSPTPSTPATTDPWQQMVMEANSPAPQRQEQGLSFPDLQAIQRATATGTPSSPEMQAAELAALWPVIAGQTGQPMTPEQAQASQWASQVLSQNPNYPEAGGGLMGFLGDIAPYAVGAIIGGAAAGLGSGAGAGAGAGGAGGVAGLEGALGSGLTATAAEGGIGAGLGTTTAGTGLAATGAGAGTASGLGGAAGTGLTTTGALGGAGALSPGFFASEGVAGGGVGAAPATGGGSSLAPQGTSLMQLAGKAIPSIFGAYASDRQSDAYSGLANQYMAMGDPYRQRLSDLYNDPSSFLNSPEVQVPVQQGTNILARSLSTKGNPIGSGNALQEMQNYATNAMYSRLGQERDRLAGYGGLSQYASAAPGMAGAGINAQRGVYDAIGAGVADIFNNQKKLSLEDLLYAQ